MGLRCKVMGCTNEHDDIRGYYEGGDYVVYGCKRCPKEIIFCSKESRFMDNDEAGRAAMAMMIKDPEFSRQCAIHSEFVRAETENPFSLEKERMAKDLIRSKYGLPDGYRPPDPVILLQKGLWNPKPSRKKAEPKSKSKTKGKEGPKPYPTQEGESFGSQGGFRYEIQPNEAPKPAGKGKSGVRYTNRFDLGSVDNSNNEHLSVEEQLKRLERRMEKHVQREEYEKAAKIRDHIAKLKECK